MPTPVQVLQVGLASDGTGTRPQTSTGMVRNDGYFRDKIAERWAQDQNLDAGFVYQLSRLPHGYAGYERQRENSKHIDRYLYGHPKGIFRSINELYPHYKHLQTHNTPDGCTCRLCAGTAKRSSDAASTSGGSTAARLRQPTAVPATKIRAFPKGSLLLRSSDNAAPVKQKQVDELGTPDIYRSLLDRLKSTEAGNGIDEAIVDSMSPDWRAGHGLLMQILDEWQTLPQYVPRGGELVLFSRTLSSDESAGWDATTRAFRRSANGAWPDRLDWEIGVVTQMPVEPVTFTDLAHVSEGKKFNVTYSGFRVEPLSQPGGETKVLSQQHKYIALHALRPFCFWHQCFNKDEPQTWHETLQHALTMASSFCLVGKSRFKGVWPDATIFSRGVYLGAELVMVGDTVRLLPRAGFQSDSAVTDIMVVTSIRLRFVNLDEADDDDYNNERPYNTCLHISGKVYTLDPGRSFDGVGKCIVQSTDESTFPQQMRSYGRWFHVLDPANPSARLEVPYTRVLGRCYEPSAMKAWVSPPPDMGLRAASFKPVNISSTNSSDNAGDVSQGLMALQEARKYSQEHDMRIDKAAGKSWFWADSRIEQLDLHEVNGRLVGLKDHTRTRHGMNSLRRALKLLDGKKGSLEEYFAERKRSKHHQEQSDSVGLASSSMNLLASNAAGQGPGSSSNSDSSSGGSSSSEEDESRDDEMAEIDAEVFEAAQASRKQATPAAWPNNVQDSDIEMYD